MSQTIKDLKQKTEKQTQLFFNSEDEMLLWFNKLIHYSNRLLYWQMEWEKQPNYNQAAERIKYETRLYRHFQEKNIQTVKELPTIKITINNEHE